MAAGAGHPGAPEKGVPDHAADPAAFLGTELEPRLDRAVAGTGHVLCVDAAHVVSGPDLCCLRSIARVLVRAASGRPRFTVLGARDAVARTLATVTHATVVTTDARCDLLRAVADRGLVGPVTRVLDNARYQRNDVVNGRAKALGIGLLFLPSYSPNRNPIERVWRFATRTAVYGKSHPTFADVRAAVQDVVDRVPTTHADKLAWLMTLRFQKCEDASLLAA